MTGRARIPLHVRFDRIGWDVMPNGCWEWRGMRVFGYGKIRFGGADEPTLMAHRVAFERWNRPLEGEEIVRHTCDNPPCINPAHLLPGCHADNVADKVLRDRSSKGEEHGRAKLNASQVIQIRQRVQMGEQQKDLALEFGVTKSTVSLIVLGKKWRHLLTPGSYVKTSRKRAS